MTKPINITWSLDSTYLIDTVDNVKGLNSHVVTAKEKMAEFKKYLEEVLGDSSGWKSHGYNFIYVDENTPCQIQYVPAYANQAAKLCQLPGFSCWRSNKSNNVNGKIILNISNWNGWSKSQLPIDKYRYYVINHETGHALGLKHQECPIEECKRRGMKDCPASIMQQMTRGLDHISPCIESWKPLDKSWIIDNPPDTKVNTVINSQVFILIFIILIVIYVCIHIPKYLHIYVKPYI